MVSVRGHNITDDTVFVDSGYEIREQAAVDIIEWLGYEKSTTYFINLAPTLTVDAECDVKYRLLAKLKEVM